MSRSDKSRADLVKLIEEQQKQILTYEKRLKDVVKAYKSLNAEKDALQATVEALSAQDESTTENVEDESGEAKDAATTSIAKGKHISDDERVETLKKSLATLTTEKNRREGALQADKKALLAENECLKERIEKSAEETEAQAERLEYHMKELRAKIKRIEGERERELADHGLVLAEMQQRYAKERANGDQMERQIAELYKKIQEKDELPNRLELRIAELTAALKEANEDAQLWRKKSEKTPTVQMLESELHNLKLESSREIAELKSRVTAAMSTERDVRLHELEERLGSMTAKLGNFERIRADDLQKVEELQKRNEQLESDKEALLMSLRKENAERSNDTESLRERIVELAEKLRTVDSHANFYAILGLEESSDEQKRRYDQLRDEFERYKLKAQAVLKNRNITEESLEVHGGTPRSHSMPVVTECASCASAEGDLRHLRSVIASLHEKLHTLEIDHAIAKRDHEETCAQMRETIVEMQVSQTNLSNKLHQQMQQKVAEMEAEMQKQRRRTLELLAEKEEELEVTKTILLSVRSQQPTCDPIDPPQVLVARPQHTKGRRTRSRELPERSNSEEERRSADGSTSRLEADRPLSAAESYSSVAEDQRLERFSSSPTSTQQFTFAIPAVSNASEARNMFYEQQIAKKDKDISSLRNSLLAAESTVRDIQQASLTKDLQHYEMAEKLKDEIRVLEGKLKFYSGDANMEYLRNVFVQLLQCESSSGRKHILKAIGTVLKLTALEMKGIEKNPF